MRTFGPIETDPIAGNSRVFGGAGIGLLVEPYPVVTSSVALGVPTAGYFPITLDLQGVNPQSVNVTGPHKIPALRGPFVCAQIVNSPGAQNQVGLSYQVTIFETWEEMRRFELNPRASPRGNRGIVDANQLYNSANNNPLTRGITGGVSSACLSLANVAGIRVSLFADNAGNFTLSGGTLRFWRAPAKNGNLWTLNLEDTLTVDNTSTVKGQTWDEREIFVEDGWLYVEQLNVTNSNGGATKIPFVEVDSGVLR